MYDTALEDSAVGVFALTQDTTLNYLKRRFAIVAGSSDGIRHSFNVAARSVVPGTRRRMAFGKRYSGADWFAQEVSGGAAGTILTSNFGKWASRILFGCLHKN